MTSTGGFRCVHGPDCTRRRKTTRPGAPVSHVRSSVVRWSLSRSRGYPGARTVPRSCGCGGKALASRTWTSSGVRMCAAFAYVRRFDLEHTFRFLKQTLNWTTPRLRHPEQADRWSWLMLSAYTQLRLARSLVADQRLPWERRISERPLTPCRVRRAFWSLLITLGTPANVPKPRGHSPGRPKGRRSGRAPRHPTLKKAG